MFSSRFLLLKYSEIYCSRNLLVTSIFLKKMCIHTDSYCKMWFTKILGGTVLIVKKLCVEHCNLNGCALGYTSDSDWHPNRRQYKDDILDDILYRFHVELSQTFHKHFHCKHYSTHPSLWASPFSSSWITPRRTLMVSWLELMRLSMACSCALISLSPDKVIICWLLPMPVAPRGKPSSPPCVRWSLEEADTCLVRHCPCDFKEHLALWGSVWDCCSFSCVSFFRLQLTEGLPKDSTCVKEFHATGPVPFGLSCENSESASWRFEEVPASMSSLGNPLCLVLVPQTLYSGSLLEGELVGWPSSEKCEGPSTQLALESKSSVSLLSSVWWSSAFVCPTILPLYLDDSPVGCPSSPTAFMSLKNPLFCPLYSSTKAACLKVCPFFLSNGKVLYRFVRSGEVWTPVLLVTLGIDRRAGIVMYFLWVTLQEMDLERLARCSFWASQISLKRTCKALFLFFTCCLPDSEPDCASMLCEGTVSESDSSEFERTTHLVSSLLTIFPETAKTEKERVCVNLEETIFHMRWLW